MCAVNMELANILINAHPELPEQQRKMVGEEVGSVEGVASFHFSPGHPHEVIVAYDPQTIASRDILDKVRKWDNEATMAGL